MIEHITTHPAQWTTILVGLVLTVLLIRKRRRDVAAWNAAHPNRRFGRGTP
jgi:hypothetical protein